MVAILNRRVKIKLQGYIVGYCLFNYAVPKPVYDYFHLYFQIIEADYFRSLGFTTHYYDSATGTFDKKCIRRAIERVTDENASRYKHLNPATGNLNYSSRTEFAKSFLTMVRNLDMTKID